MDETYVKVRGEWVYSCRAVDKAGKTVDFLLSQQRDVNAAKAQGKGNLSPLPFYRRTAKSQSQDRALSRSTRRLA